MRSCVPGYRSWLAAAHCAVANPGCRVQFATRQIIMLDIDDSPLLLPDMGRSPIDIGQHLLLLMMGLLHDPLLHIDDQ